MGDSSPEVKLEVSSIEESTQVDEFINEQTRAIIANLQKHWMTQYEENQEKVLVEITEKLHQEFLNDLQKIRSELLQEFKEELETMRTELDTKYREDLKIEGAKLLEKHRRDLSEAKKKQWCCECENEAIYHCCWNTAYCSVECQQGHWGTHRRTCRRRKPSPPPIP
ncbi:hypothetical protein B9Z55_008458 [Caenorhabditis nigoni]|uniref:MYND-type domain-containing protein n=1 Tax=Caenorhabditis nigoni TaxID=1611254 RepID=A0A2G5UMV8_9PELO|nr:hypothetical protein B9Z55_008458 [Caenorhabditis nigoni]